VALTGVGKTYLSCALAHSAIRPGHMELYLRAPRMFDELAIARADGRLSAHGLLGTR
jgi:DNA replication protein DnaC